MPVPILKQRDLLIATAQAQLDDDDLRQLSTELLERVGKHRARGVILDVTVVDVMDSFAVRVLKGIAQAVRLRGADMVIVGIQPDVAFAMVQLGLLLNDVATELDLEAGMEFLERRWREAERRAG